MLTNGKICGIGKKTTTTTEFHSIKTDEWNFGGKNRTELGKK